MVECESVSWQAAGLEEMAVACAEGWVGGGGGFAQAGG